MTLADRLNQIIAEQKLSKREFAKRIGVSENYLYILKPKSFQEVVQAYNSAKQFEQKSFFL